MSLFTVDQTKCQRDGVCARECPVGIIKFSDKNSFPTPVDKAEESCIQCGHCMAVCPHGALTLDKQKIEDLPLIHKDLMPSSESIKEFLTARRSIRRYKQNVVGRETLEELINLGSYAPTGHNKQQVHWSVFEDPAKVRRLASLVVDWANLMAPKIPDRDMAKGMENLVLAWNKGEDPILRGAPHLIMVHSQADLPTAHADCVIALTYLELYAASKGLGTCWAGYLTAAANIFPPLRAALGLPEGHRCFGAVMLGYPQHKYYRRPKRNAPSVTWC
ncbi:nitroreductase family protein [Desulfosporosinus sp. PR]|uniref:nitroreductase family protein n=1 Tax=Candidatus Desulfosporosinus nitrosoreducens TaxID=3401928 RepID=UPI0027F4EA92|nr:nitroreductase family protein [Desulfosporosinus sp. PR]MDQ7093118.1 nitroreductase family protein [Desulfosporosinus sp. PR]